MICALLLTTMFVLPSPLPATLGPPLRQAQSAARLTPDQLVEEAWRYLRPYDGNAPALLTAEDRQATEVATHLLEAALALSPDHARALWSLGHTRTLLGVDDRTRASRDRAERHFARGAEALSRAIALDPTDPWTPYARGVLHASSGAEALALADLDAATRNAEKRSAAGDDSGSWVRFKALERRAEALMRTGQHAAAREQLRSFHGEFSNNEWPLMIALAESFERERDFAAARGAYEAVLEQFPGDYQAYALLGYLEGLVGNQERAAARMLEALERELEPGMYTRLWLWILSSGDARKEAQRDLDLFLRNPPDAVTDWDRQLGRFVLGESEQAAFMSAAEAENRRRLDAAQPLDDLLCEAWFYAGLRAENEAAETADTDASNTLLRRALDAHGKALGFQPEKWKWEWAYARLHFAELASRLGLEAQAGFQTAPDAEALRIGERSISLEEATWHGPRAERSADSLGRAPLPGDLLMIRTRSAGAPVRWEQFVVGLR